MFRNVKVLIAVKDDKVRGELALQVEGLSFAVITAPDVRSALHVTDTYDILMLDAEVENGSALVVLDRWIVAMTGRPCLVMASRLDSGARVLYLQHGAWNVVQMPDDKLVLSNLLVRYGMTVLSARKIDLMEFQIKRLTRLVMIFGLVAAASLGERIFEWIRMGASLVK
jgi:DNA-binding NtrC family response regulator